MNIFYLDECPKKAAQLQYNKHVVKMILESAQMLCTAHHHYAEKHEINADYIPYKKAHYNHPSTIWVRQNSIHYDWLYDHMIALGDEYTKRYGKTHLSITKCKDLVYLPTGIPTVMFKQPPQCMPDEYKESCAIHAYWNYYIGDKAAICNTKKEKLYTEIPKALAV
jgi:hypothetical protein